LFALIVVSFALIVVLKPSLFAVNVVSKMPCLQFYLPMFAVRYTYTAYAIPQFQYYGFWLTVVVSILFVVAGVADEFFASAMGLSYQQYIGSLISAIAIILIGGLIAWVH
jgi:hypothetical protein